MAVSLVHVVLSICVILIGWLIIRRYTAKSPLDTIPGPPSLSFWTGNLGLLFDAQLGWDYIARISEKYGSVSRIYGSFGERALFVFDPTTLRSILLDNQAKWDHPSWIVARNRVIFGPSLFSTVGDRHRRQRRLLNPAFSTQNLRLMTPAFYAVAHQLRKTIASELHDVSSEIDILHWTACSALESIGRSGLGHSFDALEGGKDTALAKALKDLVPAISTFDLWRPVFTSVEKLGSGAFRRRMVESAPFANVRNVKTIVDILDRTSRDILRRKATKVQEQASDGPEDSGKDVMALLLGANPENNEGLHQEELVAQISSMLFGGTDTTSNSVARILQLLAEHQDIQAKLRNELLNASNGADIPYEQLSELPYLDAVCRETLRLYPPAPYSMRESQADTVLPFSHPIRGLDGSLIDQIYVPKGTLVLISIVSCNRNTAIWGEDTLKWNPDRWLSSLPEAVTQARIPGVYSNLLTFLAGARACIGFSFAQIEIKVLVAVLISHFEFARTEHKISWNIGAVSFPTVRSKEKSHSKTYPSLPLKVKALA